MGRWRTRASWRLLVSFPPKARVQTNEGRKVTRAPQGPVEQEAASQIFGELCLIRQTALALDIASFLATPQLWRKIVPSEEKQAQNLTPQQQHLILEEWAKKAEREREFCGGAQRESMLLPQAMLDTGDQLLHSLKALSQGAIEMTLVMALGTPKPLPQLSCPGAQSPVTFLEFLVGSPAPPLPEFRSLRSLPHWDVAEFERTLAAEKTKAGGLCSFLSCSICSYPALT